MQRLEIERALAAKDITLRSPPNWTIILFFAALAAVHGYMAASALIKHRFDSFMSLVLCCIFTIVTLLSWRIARELTVLSDGRRLRLRTGLRRLFYQRFVPFTDVRSVRLTLLHPRDPLAARIELVCDREVIECPPTTVPRQEALCLAMTLNVRLIKVYGAAFGPVAERLDELPIS
jgi:hypothetical protein